MKTYIFSTLLLISVLATGCSSSSPAPIVGTLERRRFEIAASANEPISQLRIREGDRVQQGQVLAELDPLAFAAGRDSLAAELRRARQRLAELRNGARPEELAEARARLAAVEAERDQATREFQRLSELAPRALIAQSQLDQQRRLRDAAQAAVDGAQAALQLLQKGTRAEQIAQARETLSVVEAQLAQQQVLLDRLQLRSPVDGVVEAVPYRQGERPPLGAPVVIVLAGGMPYARVYVPEPVRSRVVAGQRVQVHVDGIADAFDGQVRYVAGEASFTPHYALTQRDRSRLAFVAEIDLPEARAAGLPVGVPVEVTLEAPP
jgi:HlyD family secretion protein